MDILLFGGAFDPVHNGHLNILKAALRYKHFDKVIIMPTGTPGHKTGCRAPFIARKIMCEKAFRNLGDNIEISDFEGRRFEKNFSYITVSHLKRQYPGANIWFLIGADSAVGLNTWKNSDYLKENCSFIVLPRKTENDPRLLDAVENIKLSSPGTFLLNAEAYPISSTEIREAVARGKSAADFLPWGVRDIVSEYSLYDSDFYKRNIGTAKLIIPQMTDEKRMVHTYNVANLAGELAKRYGESENDAYLAGLLHDIQKQAPKEELLFRAERCMGKDILKKPIPVLHGYRAADYMTTEMGITDENLLAAVKNHTTGRVGMSNLEKIIYMADMTSAERNYPEKDMLYNLVWQDLDICMETALKESLKWIESKGRVLDTDSLAAYEYFKNLNANR